MAEIAFGLAAAVELARRARGSGEMLALVKDDGVYLIGPGVPGDPGRLVYADGLGPAPEPSRTVPAPVDDPWTAHRELVERHAGGDDFAEPVDPAEVLGLAERAGSAAAWLVCRTEVEEFELPAEMAAGMKAMWPGTSGRAWRLRSFELAVR